MYSEKELEKIKEGIYSEESLDSLLKAFLNEMEKEELENLEKEYQDSKKMLDSILTDKQKEDLLRMETLFSENMQYAIGYAFKKGIYIGFKQFYIKEGVQDPFDKIFYREILTIPDVEKNTEYYDRLMNINKLFDSLMKTLESDNKECLTTVYFVYDEKNYSILWNSFYLGYSYALLIIGEQSG